MADRRRPAPEGDELRRSESIEFRFDGARLSGVGGDTIASALVAKGVDVLSRSFKYHRPRGVLCVAGRCPNCLVEVDGEPNVRACVTPITPGATVRSQNAWPSLRRDLLSLTDQFDRFFPIGFYYKSFIRPRRFWPLYERILRRIAGLGRIDVSDRPDLHPRKRHLHAEVAVIGGGPAGCLAALEAAAAGARVVLVDDGLRLGGHLRTRTRVITAGDPRIAGLAGRDAARRLADLVAAEPGIEHLPGATAIGIYDGGLVGITHGSTFVRLRADRIVLATGATERPALFDANDRPGIMLASGILRLAHLHGVRAGERAIVVTDDDHGWRQAAELAAAGIRVEAIIDERAAVVEPVEAATIRGAGTQVLVGAIVLAANGRSRVTGLRVRTADGTKRTIAADLVAMAARPEPVVGLAAQAGLPLAFEERLAEWIPMAGTGGVVSTGQMTGLVDDALIAAGAVLAGRVAADHGRAGDAAIEHAGRVTAAFAALPGRAPTALPAGRKPFVCLCEDVTVKELVQGVREGFESLETLKRYSTVTMGPCQGKQCHGNAARVTAAIRRVSRTTTALTTHRPPVQPVPLAILAGPHLDPVRRTAIHDRHETTGATWMDMGDWKRPLDYGDVAAECRAVREGVGLIDVSTLGKLDVRGPDAGEFLDWLHPNRISDLQVGRIRYRAMTDDSGIILDDGTVARLGRERYLVTTGTGSVDAVDGWLRWWLAASDRRVDVTNVTARFAAMNLAGPRARDVLSRVTDLDVSADGLRYLDAREGLVAGVQCVILRIGFVGELAFELHAPADQAAHVWDAVIATGIDFGIRPFGVEAQRVLRLEKQHAIVGQDTDALSGPRAASMGWLIKPDRPDFIGRDAIAALDARGLRDVLTGFEMIGTAVPAEGAAVVRDGRLIGRVTSSKWSPTLNKAIGLAWLPTEDAIDDRPITIRLGTGRDGSTAPAVVRTSPFYDPAGERVRA